MQEKYWQTISAMLLIPMNRLSLIGGVGLAEIIAILPSLVIFLGLSFLLMPISLVNLFIILLALMLMFVISLSIGLLAGCATLFNENFSPLFSYARIVIVFFSCFYYPLTVLSIPQLGYYGQILPTIAFINPIYQATSLMRTVWTQGIIPLDGFLYVLFFAIVSPILAVYIFRRLFRMLSIQGY